MRYLLAFSVCLLLSRAVLASEEGALPLQEFQVSSQGIGESGPIVVTGAKNDDGRFREITVVAFGKTFALPQPILDQLSQQFQNGLQLSYEAGYPNLGGRTIYLQFQFGFTSGPVRSVVVAISEDGKSRIL
jgi:hypothetical protein